jgi:hypothetical protein
MSTTTTPQTMVAVVARQSHNIQDVVAERATAIAVG